MQLSGESREILHKRAARLRPELLVSWISDTQKDGCHWTGIRHIPGDKVNLRENRLWSADQAAHKAIVSSWFWNKQHASWHVVKNGQSDFFCRFHLPFLLSRHILQIEPQKSRRRSGARVSGRADGLFFLFPFCNPFWSCLPVFWLVFYRKKDETHIPDRHKFLTPGFPLVVRCTY